MNDPCDVADGYSETDAKIEAEERAHKADELETLRMQLVACEVVALANTPKSAKFARIDRDNPYWSASLAAVEGAVDREMALRAEVERFRDLAKRIGRLNKYGEATSESLCQRDIDEWNEAIK